MSLRSSWVARRISNLGVAPRLREDLFALLAAVLRPLALGRLGRLARSRHDLLRL